MADYRAYILGINGHRFVRVEDFLTDHPDDAAALTAGKAICDKHEVEVWDGSRLVALLSPGESGPSPGLVPTLMANFEKKAASSAEPISLSKVSEKASASSAASTESNPFVQSTGDATE
jgi:hypothetical protein